MGGNALKKEDTGISEIRMEETDNKTIMCGVLFLDIVEYSKKPVSGQISLKDRFNSYLSAAIRDVPIVDRIILDTGDGAAINFLGDVEDALRTALSLRESLLNEGISVDSPLLVRMGINLGPVRLVRDINGQPNIVGDGINVAQRVMGFADAAQILVSRSYYDAVSRLSPRYAGMFHYQGSRTDKHVREHEVYAIGYPGDQTIEGGKRLSEAGGKPEWSISGRARSVWRFAVSNLNALIEHPVESFRNANLKQGAFFAGVIATPLILVILLSIPATRREASITAPPGPESAGAPAERLENGDVSSGRDVTASDATAQRTETPMPPTQETGKPVEPSAAKPVARKAPVAVKREARRSETGAKDRTKPIVVSTLSSIDVGTFVSSSCKGAELFIDGTRKGKVGPEPLTVRVLPGKHSVIVSHAKGVYSQEVVFDTGKTVQINPDFCN